MTSEEVVRRLRAFEKGKPLARGETLRVIRLPDEQCLIVAFVKMGGESSPWGIAYGRPGRQPEILTIPDARTRDDVAEMSLEFAAALLTHLNHPKFSPWGPDPETNLPPFQVWLPNASHLEMLHYLAYAYTFTRFGPMARHTRLNQLGHACGWLFREAHRPGQMIVNVATDVLKEAYAFPAEDTRLGHLGFDLAWLETTGSPEVRTRAAAEAERHSVGANMDPDVEREELAPYVEMYDDARRAGDTPQMERAKRRIRKLLSEELQRRFALTERAIQLLRIDRRRENKGLARLLDFSMQEHRLQYRRIEQNIDDRDDGPAFRPSPETDRYPAAAGSRFFFHEASQELVDLFLIHDDREMQAQVIASGEAIAGRIVEVRDEGSGKHVPVWIVESNGELPLRLHEEGTLCVVGLPDRRLRIRAIERTPELRYRFELVVTGLLTVPKNNDGSVLPANSLKLKGEPVVLVRPSWDEMARRRSRLIWNREVPGAWLTHATPKVAESHLPEEIAEDLETLEGGRR